MNGSRERLAWTILLISLCLCLSLTVTLPVGINTILQVATRSLEVTVQTNQGTVVIFHNGAAATALLAGRPPARLNPHGVILTDAPDTALILVHPPRSRTLLARLQIYGNSNIRVERATAPRFQVSSQEQQLTLRMVSGRVQLVLPPLPDRPFVLRVSTPHGLVAIHEPGQYAIEVSNAHTLVAVQRGQVELISANGQLTLVDNTRALMALDGPPIGPLDSERNLVQNGDFAQELAQWVEATWQTELPDQPDVQARVISGDGEPFLQFERIGLGHADGEIRQEINQDVADFQSLRLLLSMRLVHHSLDVCGIQGSECPLIVQIEYEDVNGGGRIWQQGFYATGQVSPATAPNICRFCGAPNNPHHQTPLDQLYFYETGNLMENLGQQGLAPRRIHRISLIASGHTFQTEVVEVGLLARE
jgi:hypothetical protein